jgi:FHS family L-fucose permease-like MFS transporter
MIGTAAPDRHHRCGWARAQLLSESYEGGSVALQLILNAVRGFGSLPIHDSFHGTADSANVFKGAMMNQKNRIIILYIMTIWFLISFVTNIIGPLIPIIIKWYKLNYALAGFLPFSFFAAYGIISIPAGFLLERRGQGVTMLGAFVLNGLGCLLIATSASYLAVIAGLFVIGLGMAMLQVVINPLTRSTVGEEHFAFYAVLGQLVFGAASFLSPFALTLLQTNERTFAALGPPWVPFYAGAGVVFACFIAVTAKMRLPRAEFAEDERVGSFRSYRELLGNKTVLLFFLGIVAYVGTEQGLADWMGQFLLVYHRVPAETTGAYEVSLFWGLMVIGCMLGLVLLRLLDSQLILRIFGAGAVGCVVAALLGSAQVSLIAFPLCGFALSVMWSIIFALALNSVAEHHGSFTGILCTGILGGALIPLAIGWLGDQIGLRSAMFLIVFLLGYIISISFWARPLTRNERVWKPEAAANA